MIDGRAMEGLVMAAVVGIGAMVVLFFTVPPALLIGLMWLIEPRTGIAWHEAAWWIGGLWIGSWFLAAVAWLVSEFRS